jgi:hypothetical protein
MHTIGQPSNTLEVSQGPMDKVDLNKEIMILAGRIIDYAEVAITSRTQYEVFRSRVLRLANNLIKKIEKGV